MTESVAASQSNGDDDAFAFDDIETAYRQALEALDAAERQVGSAFVEFSEPAAPVTDEASVAQGVSIGEQLAEELRQQPDINSSRMLQEGLRRVSPREVIEAAVFVGGEVSLTARKLASLIGQDVDGRVAVSLVDSLNQTYSRENRPYEIRLAEGGYRLELRDEFAEITTRTFGTGPRNVKLAPETLEVLAFIAWNQPVERETLETIDKPGVMNHLRQLLRLQLVELRRTGQKRTDVTYVTTAKFLKLFGLKSLAELPNSDVFAFK